jgi:hypothetical protein
MGRNTHRIKMVSRIDRYHTESRVHRGLGHMKSRRCIGQARLTSRRFDSIECTHRIGFAIGKGKRPQLEHCSGSRKP